MVAFEDDLKKNSESLDRLSARVNDARSHGGLSPKVGSFFENEMVVTQ
jgi:hypothetical protein